MKKLILVWLASFLPLAHATFEQCPKSVLDNKHSARALGFLQSIKGNYQLGKCFVELSVCEGSQDTQQPDSTVADLLVTDKRGEKFYVPISFSPSATPLVKNIIKNGRRMVHYTFIERLPDPVHGRTEAYRLEVVKTENLARIERLELGIYYSKIREKYPQLPPGRSYWVICEP